MNRHFVQDALGLVLGAKKVFTPEPKPEWKNIGPDLWAHRDTGMLKFTPPEPVGAEDKPTKTNASLVYDSRDDYGRCMGYPPEPGWYCTSGSTPDKHHRGGLWRWTNGKSFWSRDSYGNALSNPAHRAGIAAWAAATPVEDVRWHEEFVPPWGRNP